MAHESQAEEAQDDPGHPIAEIGTIEGMMRGVERMTEAETIHDENGINQIVSKYAFTLVHIIWNLFITIH